MYLRHSEVMPKPIFYFPDAKKQAALRAAMEGRISGRTLASLSALELFQLARTPEYQQTLQELGE